MSVDALESMWGEGVKLQFLAEMSALVEERLEAEPDLRAAFAAVQERIATRERKKLVVPSSEAKEGVEPGREDGLPDAREMANFESMLETEALERFYARHFAPVALAGRVPVKVDTQYGAIEAGTALAPSPIPGVAMKDDGQGPVIGIALESFSGGLGKVEAFVTRGQGASSQAVAQSREFAEQVERRTPDPVTGVQSLPGHLQIVLDDDADDEARLSVFRDGSQEDGGAEVFRVDEEGNVFAKGSFRPSAMDVPSCSRSARAPSPGMSWPPIPNHQGGSVRPVTSRIPRSSVWWRPGPGCCWAAAWTAS